MRHQLLLFSSLLLLVVGCESRNNVAARSDNTVRNARDRNGQTLTPMDQSENEMDRNITQRIRQALMDDDTLSTNAKNIKIITRNGVVTLRGAVNNEREKAEIIRKISATSGIRSMDNQLEVITNENGAARMNGDRRNSLR